jgi:HK97 family phage portal protein
MLETRAFQIADIARFFGVPLFLLMDSEKSTSWGTGMEQQNLSFLTYTLQPYLRKMVQTFNRRLIPPAERGKVCVDVDVTPLQIMDSTSLQAFLNAGAQNGMFTRNEARRRYLKLPKSTEENADVLTVQTALTPLSKLGITPPTPNSTPAPATAGAQS